MFICSKLDFIPSLLNSKSSKNNTIICSNDCVFAYCISIVETLIMHQHKPLTYLIHGKSGIMYVPCRNAYLILFV